MAGSGGGLLSRLGTRLSWLLMKRERVGIDPLGNIYYRKMDKNADGEEIERRIVKYAGDPDPVHLPTEWLQWLRRTRSTAPTEEDMAKGAAQRQLFAARVKELEAEDARRRLRERTARSAGGEPEVQSFVHQLTEQGYGGAGGSTGGGNSSGGPGPGSGGSSGGAGGG